MPRAKTALSCVASALLLLLAFPPFDLAPLVFVALIPLLMSLRDCTARGAWRRGYLFGLVFALGQLHWLDPLTATWTGSAALGLVPWLLAAVVMALYFGLLGLAIRTCFVRNAMWAIPFVWAGMEVLRSYIPMFAFPWCLVATPLWRYPAIIQTGKLGTIFLLGAWVLAVNLALALVLARRPAGDRPEVRTLAAMVAASLLLPAISLIQYSLPQDTHPMPVTVGQTGVDMAFTKPEVGRIETYSAVGALVSAGLRAHSRLLVLPEGLALYHPGESRPLLPLDPRLPTLFGAERVASRDSIYQSAVAFQNGSETSVDKTRLVIFGEFVPGRDFLPFLSAFHLPSGDLSAGENGTRAVSLGRLTVGPIICFEEMFPDLGYKQAMNGSQVLAVVSIDDWFMGSSAPEELKASAIWRAVETGVPLVRAASGGYSFATDGMGRILAEAPLKQMDALQVQLPIRRQPSNPVWLPCFPLFALGVLLSLPISRLLSGALTHRKDSNS